MPFDYQCPHCGAETVVDDQYAGQSGPCHTCGKLINLPLFDSGGALAVGAATVAASQPRAVRAPAISLLLALGGGMIAACGMVALLILILLPAYESAVEAAHEKKCRANLAQIVNAMRQYSVEHGTFPPAYLADDSGKPMHSWRVLLLPYLGQEGLYEQYNFDETWDSPQNIALANLMPSVYGCPANPDAVMQGETSYMVIVGKGTAFPGEQPVTPAQMGDDASTTILVVETSAKGVVWLEPKDLTVGTFQYAINMGDKEEIGSRHFGGAYVGMADGSVKWLNEIAAPEVVESLTTINGGDEPIYNVFDRQ